MLLAPRCLADDLRVGPAHSTEVIGQSNPRQPRRSRGAAALSDRNVVSDTQRKRNDFRGTSLQDLAVGRENQMILQVLTDLRIAPGGANGKVACRPGIDRDVEVHRQSGRVEGRPQIGRSCRESQMQCGWMLSL